MGPTLPAWIWVIYYAFFLITFIISVYVLIKDESRRILSGLNIVLIPLLVISNIFFALSRSGVNELSFFLNQLGDLNLFAILILLATIYLFYYFFSSFKRLSNLSS